MSKRVLVTIDVEQIRRWIVEAVVERELLVAEVSWAELLRDSDASHLRLLRVTASLPAEQPVAPVRARKPRRAA